MLPQQTKVATMTEKTRQFYRDSRFFRGFTVEEVNSDVDDTYAIAATIVTIATIGWIRQIYIASSKAKFQ